MKIDKPGAVRHIDIDKAREWYDDGFTPYVAFRENFSIQPMTPIQLSTGTKNKYKLMKSRELLVILVITITLHLGIDLAEKNYHAALAWG